MVSQSSPIETMKFLFKDYFFYMLYFQNEGIVEKELEKDMKSSLMNIYGSLQSDGSSSETFQPKPLTKDMTFLKSIGSFDKIPKWLTEEDFNYYLSRFQNGGMRGPINWYRNIDRNWEITKDTHQSKINVPTCFLCGEDDPVSVWAPIDKNNYSKLELSKIIKGAGHWLQQEKPEEVNKIILDFFKLN
jgi:pimeloyl-ACP methyl ester carboxylesterase